MEQREVLGDYRFEIAVHQQQRPWRPTTRKRGVSIVIPVFEDADGLRSTLTSLSKVGVLANPIFEVIVANDSRSAQITDVCVEFNVREVKGSQGGSYSARNYAAAVSEAEYLAFLDADVEVTASWPSAVAETISRGLDYAGGQIRVARDESHGRVHNVFLAVFEFPCRALFHRWQFCPTANLIVKRHVFECVGGFDSRLRSGGDVEFGRRLARTIPTCRREYVSEMTVIHPPRSPQQYRRKLARQAFGHHSLGVLHSQLFPEYSSKALFRQAIAMLFGWRDFRDKLAEYEDREGIQLNRVQKAQLLYYSKAAHGTYLAARVKVILQHLCAMQWSQ